MDRRVTPLKLVAAPICGSQSTQVKRTTQDPINEFIIRRRVFYWELNHS